MTTTSREELLAELEADAEYLQPRAFAMYGIYHSDGAPFLGWGLDYYEGALFYEPDNRCMTHGSSAEQLRDLHARIADVRLLWVDAFDATTEDATTEDVTTDATT